MLRVHRLAAAIDMIAAGTSAPIAIAANAKPVNHDGNTAFKRAGTASVGECTRTCAATAMNPSSAIAPSSNE